MSVRVNVRTSKIMCTPVKVGVRTYATYANCRTLSLTSYVHWILANQENYLQKKPL